MVRLPFVYIAIVAMYSTSNICPTAVLLCLSYLALRTGQIFIVMGVILCGAPADEPVYQFMDRKSAKRYKIETLVAM